MEATDAFIQDDEERGKKSELWDHSKNKYTSAEIAAMVKTSTMYENTKRVLKNKQTREEYSIVKELGKHIHLLLTSQSELPERDTNFGFIGICRTSPCNFQSALSQIKLRFALSYPKFFHPSRSSSSLALFELSI